MAKSFHALILSLCSRQRSKDTLGKGCLASIFTYCLKKMNRGVLDSSPLLNSLPPFPPSLIFFRPWRSAALRAFTGQLTRESDDDRASKISRYWHEHCIHGIATETARYRTNCEHPILNLSLAAESTGTYTYCACFPIMSVYYDHRLVSFICTQPRNFFTILC